MSLRTRRGKMAKVLLIDDEESALKNMGDFFKVKGYEVWTALDGNAGLEIVKTQLPDVVVLDLHLKEGPTGTQILRAIKLIKPETKVIIFTGFGDDDDVQKNCTELGSDAFLSKPASLKDMVLLVEKMVLK
jgi:response regulator RpfG family c-di-GMP phosphodiesterase